MSHVTQIQCPSCGANSTFKKPDGTYHCNYCQGTFEVEEDQPKNDFKEQKKKELLELLQKQQKVSKEDILNTIKASQPEVAAAGKKLGCIITVVTLTFVAGILSFVFFKVNKSMKESGIDIFSDWQSKSLSGYQCYLGSKGPVAWQIYSQSRNKLDSAKYTIKIVDPATQKVLEEKLQVPVMTWKESFQVEKQVSSQFFQMGDIAYNVSEDNGLVGYDIYTYDVKEDEESLSKKFPELKSGISKADYMWNKDAFSITNNNGKEYVYYPESNQLIAKQDDDNDRHQDTLTSTDVYLSDNKQAEAYLIRVRGDKKNPGYDVRSGIVEDYPERKDHYKRSYHIYSLQKLSGKVYFRALPMARYQNNLIVLYTDNLSKKAKIHLESIGTDGNPKWTNTDAILQDLKTTSDKIHCEFHSNGNLLILNVSSPKRKTICFDLASGKLLWTYSPEKNN
jgi:hypothetical protein